MPFVFFHLTFHLTYALSVYPCCHKQQDFLLQWLKYIHMTFSLFIHSSVDTSHFYILAIVNNAAMNVGVHFFELIFSFPLVIFIPRSEIAVLNGSSIFNFFEDPLYSFPQWLHPFAFSPTVQEVSLFSTTPSPAFLTNGFDLPQTRDLAESLMKAMKCLPRMTHLYKCIFLSSSLNMDPGNP